MNMNPEKFVDAMNAPFSCRRCGTCCIVWKIPVTDDDIEREPLLADTSENGFMIKGGNNKPCPYYDIKNGCTIHDTRPQACRDFKASPVKCMAAKITTLGIDVGATVERWKEEKIDEATILSRIYSQYINTLSNIFKMKKYVIGGRTIKDDLNDDFLLKTVKNRTLNSNVR